MAILVTGGAGYIGSVTAEILHAQGEEVVVLDDLARGHREALPSGVPFYQGKVGDRDLFARISKEHKLESCIHFAALAYVGESVQEPLRYFENNVEQGIAFLGSLLRAGVRRMVFSSTCATYGEPTEIPISERMGQWPVNPYGWSKLTMERILDSYDLAYGLKFVSLRYFNAAGATERCGEHHEPESHLIPNILSAAAGSKPEVPVFGKNYPTPDGTAIRDYVHVVDLADAHIRSLGHLRKSGKSDFLNLGTGHGYSVLEVIDAARQVTKRDIRTRIEPPRPGDPARLVADSAKAKQVLGWAPSKSDLHSIIDSAWKWQQRHPRGYST
jgi:UDP-glucose 4-epimerase